MGPSSSLRDLGFRDQGLRVGDFFGLVGCIDFCGVLVAQNGTFS